jgi:hypothetical protein
MICPRILDLSSRYVANELGKLDRIAGTLQPLGHALECAMRPAYGQSSVNYRYHSN